MSYPSTVLGNVFTLGALELDTLREFYLQLGWEPIVDEEDYVAFQLRGAVLALFPLEKLANDGRCAVSRARGGIRFSIGIMADEPDDLELILTRVRQAGGEITKDVEDAEFFAGKSAYFKDPEGNFWEVAWAPNDNPIIVASREAAGELTGQH